MTSPGALSLAPVRRDVARGKVLRPGPRRMLAALWAGLTLAIVAAFAVSVTTWTPAALLALPLVLLTAVWIAGGAATIMLGSALPPARRVSSPDGWRPTGETAILVTLCGEAPAPLAQALQSLRAGLDRLGLGATTRIFVLSDTADPGAIAEEAAVFEAAQARGDLVYRRRARNIGRKPGNIADWLDAQGHRFAFMMVLDADSRMSPDRIRRLIRRMEERPALGLLQAGIGLVPGATRFGRHQRTAARLLGHGFGRGFAAWTGDSGNYWGHNAIMRVAAFRGAARLPRLAGRAPFGGDVLSHDFVEAAWIRRAGWAVALDPDPSGSAEDAPQTLASFHRRDRRWCQGNLQHLRLLAEPGLDPVSRIHLASGILGYLVAPIWLALVLMMATGAVPVAGALPLAVVAAVLILPKLCALAGGLRRARTQARRRVVLRAWAGELATSSLIAPLIMLRQAASVASVALGRDCGWKAGAARPRAWMLSGWPESVAGLGLLLIAGFAGGAAALWLLPAALPLCLSPLIIRAMDAPA